MLYFVNNIINNVVLHLVKHIVNSVVLHLVKNIINNVVLYFVNNIINNVVLHLVKNIVNNVVLYFVNSIINVVLSTVNKVVKTKINNIHRLTYVFLSLLRMENPYHIHVVPFSLNKFKHTLLDADDFQETPRMV